MIDLSKYKHIFLSDSKRYLLEMNNNLIALEKDPQNQEYINCLFRTFHSLKGMSATMSYASINELSHVMESFLSNLRNGQVQFISPIADILFEGKDLIEKMVEEIASDSPVEVDYKTFIRKVTEFNFSKKINGGVDTFCPVTIDQPSLTSIPVESQLLDNLLNIVGEMTTLQSKILGTDKSKPLLNIREDLSQMENFIKKMHSEVTQIRLMPLDTLTAVFPRLVRELGKATGKKIHFEVKGEDIKLDRIILEELWDPLTHLIRNAIDHGIEYPQIRWETNKPPEGKITLWTSREKDTILIGLSDDGNGVDVKQVGERAVEKGILTPEQANNIWEEDMLSILAVPGFTTRRKPNQISGRGVGLDLIKNRIESLGGSLSLSFQPQKGSSYIMKLPMNLAIIQAILVRLNRQIFAVPLNKVTATAEITAREIKGPPEERAFMFQGDSIALLDLNESLGLPSRDKSGKNASVSIVMVETKNRIIGLMVDELIGCHQIFVKPLKQPLKRMELFSGTTIWGDGKITLVLDMEKL